MAIYVVRVATRTVNGDGCHEAMSPKGTHHIRSIDRRHYPAAITITRNYRMENKDFSLVSINGRFIKLNNARVLNFDRGNSSDRVFDVNGVVFEELAITPEDLALFPNTENEFIHRASFATELGVKHMRRQLSNDNYKYVLFDGIKVSSDGFNKAWGYMLSCKPL